MLNTFSTGKKTGVCDLTRSKQSLSIIHTGSPLPPMVCTSVLEPMTIIMGVASVWQRSKGIRNTQKGATSNFFQRL